MTFRGTKKLSVLGVAAAAVLATSAPALAEGGEQSNPASWGLDRIDQRTGFDQKFRYDTKAEQVTAYVIDTGIDPRNPDFGGRVLSGKDFVDHDNDATDGNGHGTHLAGIVGGASYGVAKGVKLIGVRVLDNTGGGGIENILAGIDWVTRHALQPSVAVLGLGGAPNEQLDEAVRRLAAVMPVAVPAGGEASDAGQFSPGRVAEALTVGASDSQDRLAKDSNTGPAVDVFAPGVEIPSAKIGTSEPAVLSGTSTAAAHVAGAAALYRALHPEATPDQVAKALTDNATKDVLAGVPQGTGNRLLYTGSAG